MQLVIVEFLDGLEIRARDEGALGRGSEHEAAERRGQAREGGLESLDEFEVEDDHGFAGLIEEERGDTLGGASIVDLDGEWLGSHAKNPGGRGRAPRSARESGDPNEVRPDQNQSIPGPRAGERGGSIKEGESDRILVGPIAGRSIVASAWITHPLSRLNTYSGVKRFPGELDRWSRGDFDGT